jgi:hypothetical protein
LIKIFVSLKISITATFAKENFHYHVFSSFLKKSELISAVWLAGWLAGCIRSQNWEEIETSGFLQSIL